MTSRSECGEKRRAARWGKGRSRRKEGKPGGERKREGNRERDKGVGSKCDRRRRETIVGGARNGGRGMGGGNIAGGRRRRRGAEMERGKGGERGGRGSMIGDESRV